jgi:catechol 2,3-dioxygenase-like lactoylglutathione lyase family enzyme
MTRPLLERMCPFFIVSNAAQSIAFYRDKLGFETWYQEPDDEPFFAVVGRDGAQLFLKAGGRADAKFDARSGNEMGRLCSRGRPGFNCSRVC